MSKLEIAKQVIRENYTHHDCGIYSTRNIVGDPMYTIYDKDGLTIDVCDYYEYFEVFGLSNEEFVELKKFYRQLRAGEIDKLLEDEDE